MNRNSDPKLKKVVNWLRSNGYYHVEIGPNNEYVFADGRIRKMAISVTSELKIPKKIKESVLKKANHTHREPWIARINNEDKDISWERIREDAMF